MPASAEDPRVTRSRELILTAAASIFLELGFQGVSVDQVAERAGIAKRTIYNLYGDKETLFRATILQSISVAEDFSGELVRHVRGVGDPLAELPEIAARLAESVLSDRVLPLRRLLVMESHRFPDLVTEYRRRAPEAVMHALAELFDDLVRQERLRPADPRLLAEHFAFLAFGADLDRGMFASQDISPSQIRDRALAGAEAFLRAYAG
ncbi:TetR/AcrR family transcriptional regulator [Mycobacterium sp. 236(2023)]|uniref:TetR/AcrR family transcriptional regulator n=1 Tax=Mycobacterium sp. 236(2023) TaxID=3038163 RepID=UPI00241500B1|nr:TetR/AcrR family transcriptional regulator [Mycobacterium sp. 236(2023)]MDG4662969.1 TetR/AcrR family transcriptional regulator [Mycobacterium sp. 236(2023)]